MQINKKKYLILFAVLIFLTIFFIKYNEVDNNLTASDIENIEFLLHDFEIDKNTNIDNLDFISKIQFIQSIQKKIVNNPFKKKMIKKNHDREPKDYLNIRPNICYDNSRVMQKIYNYFGIDTVQVAVYAKSSFLSFFKLFFVPKIRSHSLSLLKIENKYLLVDSTNNFISVDKNFKSIPINKIKNYYNSNWQYSRPHEILSNDHFIIFGLYSRHGKFYRPFWHFPDINWSEFKLNFFKFL